MVLSLDSEDMDVFLELHANAAFDSWNTDAQHNPTPAWCQRLSSDDAKQTPAAYLPTCKKNVPFFKPPHSRALSSVSSFDLGDDARAIHVSPEHGLSRLNLAILEAQNKLKFEAYIRPTDIHYHTGHDCICSRSNNLNRTIWKWLRFIPITTEQRSCVMRSLNAGFLEQSTITTTNAINAYQAEPEKAMTENESYQRQKDSNKARENSSEDAEFDVEVFRARFPGAMGSRPISTTKKWYPPWEQTQPQENSPEDTEFNEEDFRTRFPGAIGSRPISKTKKWYPPWEQVPKEKEYDVCPPPKPRRTPTMKHGDRKRVRLTPKAKESSRQVTGADWTALGDRRRRM